MADHSNHKNWDVIIVGGGIIGLSSGWRLAQAKLKVLILDRQMPGQEASSAAAGMLAPYTEAEEDTPLLRLSIASREIYPAFSRELESETGRSAHYRTDGALFLALDEHEARTLQARQAWQAQMGFAVECLEGAALKDAEPALSPEVKLALFYPGDHQLDNRALVESLLAADKRLGVLVRSGVTARRLIHEGNRVVGVDAEGEKFFAQTVVLAAGAWSPQIDTGVDETIPIYPTRGQIIAVRSTQPILKHTLRYEGGYVAIFPENRFLLGGTMEDVGYHKVNTVAAMNGIFQRAGAVVPDLGSCAFIESWAGLRPNTRDHFPILGKSSLEGLVYATGHFRNGILLTPITAQIVSELIVEGKTATDLQPFRVQRFARV